jgi:hypothetical protein
VILPAIRSSQALHVVMRVDPAVDNLRRRKLYKAMRDATIIVGRSPLALCPASDRDSSDG